MFNRPIRLLILALALTLFSVNGAPLLAQESSPRSVVALTTSASAVTWQTSAAYARAVLTVALPGGEVLRREFIAGEPIKFALTDSVGDGLYQYQLVLLPQLSAEEVAAARAARESGTVGPAIRTLVQSGAFRLEAGKAIVPGAEESAPARSAPQSGEDLVQPQDQVIADDLIVQGSGCFGFDCVDNESFGFDTIRLKENNTRIGFDDTSASAGFPARDWQIVANDSASGGADYLGFLDVTSGFMPFRVTGAAPNNSLFVSSTGRIGLRTSTPVLDVHMATGNTPAIRFEQDATGGFTAQTWDVAGNEANFFVRDITGGSRLPFRIRPGAPTSSIDIAASGNVGIGTASPQAKLHVAGNVLVQGVVTEFSDVNAKENLAAVDGAAVLDQLMSVPVYRWNYKNDAGDLQHMGPMAQAFYAEFQLGTDDKHIAALDLNGALLAATQELNREMQAKDRALADLQAQNADLQAQMRLLQQQLKLLEARLNALARP
ncbi:MAG: tail fiber domain-containing protein [Anaerolineales bacterium]